jgi:pimeloyl-ACP methyl ester carboxylesterase
VAFRVHIRIRAMLLAVVLGLVILFVFKSFTLPILGSGSVAQLTRVEVNGNSQYLLIRGRNREKPVLLFLHGGPGMPAMFLAHSFQSDLERDFVVVHWDQRAAGKSFVADIDPRTISTRQYLDDLYVVVDMLRDQFGQDKIYLLGHSHGSYLGVLASFEKPEKFQAYIGVGQVVDSEKARAYQEVELRTRLEEIGIGPETEINSANMESLLFQVGGALYCCQSFTPLLLTGLVAPEYSLLDAYNVKRGSDFSSQHMRYDVILEPLGDAIQKLSMPVYFISGAHDLTTPTAISRAYFESMVAPKKAFFEIDEAAHFPFFEQPREFADILVKIKGETIGHK